MKLSRLTIPYRALKSSTSIAFVILISSSYSLSEINLTSIGVLSALAGTVILGNLLWHYVVWRNYSYRFKNNSIKIKHGVLRKRDRKIPLKRIQNVDLKKNIFQRALGITELKLETAGGDSTEASFQYLEVQKAEEIRDKLRNQEPLEEKKKNDEEPLYEISDRELLLLSATSIDSRILAGIFAFFAIAPTILGDFMNELSLGILVGGATLLIGISLTTWISSTVTNFLKYWGFKLHMTDDSLEYERGLLNRSEGSIPREKIQKVTVKENFLKRIFGYASLSIDTAGYSPTQSVEKGAEVAIPMAKKQEILQLTEEIHDVREKKWNNVSRRARARYASRYLIGSIILVSMTALAPLEAPILVLIVLLTVISLSAAHLKWKNKGYNSGENHVITVNGFWNRSTSYTPYFRIQNLIESQTILQRRWRLSTVNIDTAGSNNIFNQTSAVDLDPRKAEEFKKEIFKKFQNSLK